MSRVGELPVHGLVPYTSTEYSVSLFMNIVVGPLGLLTSLIVVWSMLRQRHIPTSSQFILSICIGDVFVNCVGIMFGIMDLHEGGWSTGQIGCMIDAEITVYGECISILSLLAMTVERYIVIIKQGEMTQKQVNLILIFIWIVMGVVICFPSYLNYNSFLGGLQPGKLVCAVAWWDTRIESRISNGLVVGAVLTVMIGINMIYTEIFMAFRKAQRDRDDLLQGASMIGQESGSVHGGHAASGKLNTPKGFLVPLLGLSEKERQLLIKCALITGSFMICWLPMLTKILYEMITNTPSSSGYDLFCTVFAAMNTIINGFLLIFLDNRVKSQVLNSLPEQVRVTVLSWSKKAESPGGTESSAVKRPSLFKTPQQDLTSPSENFDV